MKNTRGIVFLSLFLVIGINTISAQLKKGIYDVSISVTHVNYGFDIGYPTLNLSPIHSGIEVGTTFLKKDKGTRNQHISASVGFFHHNTWANAGYIKGQYHFQLILKQKVGVDFNTGVGYLHAFYPGEGYRYNNNNQFETVLPNQAYLTLDGGIAISYEDMDRIKPFIGYDLTGITRLYNTGTDNTFIEIHAVTKLKIGCKMTF